MKIQFPKSRTFDEVKNGELFTYEFGNKTYNCMRTIPIINQNDVEFNAINIETGEYIYVDERDYVVVLKGHYVVEE